MSFLRSIESIVAALVVLHVDGMLSQEHSSPRFPPTYYIQLHPLLSANHQVILLNDVVNSLFSRYWEINAHQVQKISFIGFTKTETWYSRGSSLFLRCDSPAVENILGYFCVANFTWVLRTTKKYKRPTLYKGIEITLKVIGTDSIKKNRDNIYRLMLIVPSQCSDEVRIYTKMLKSCQPKFNQLIPVKQYNTYINADPFPKSWGTLIFNIPSHHFHNTVKLTTLKFTGLHGHGLLRMRIFYNNVSILHEDGNISLHITRFQEILYLNQQLIANLRSLRREVKVELFGDWKTAMSFDSKIYLQYYIMESFCRNEDCLQRYFFWRHTSSKTRREESYRCFNDTIGLFKMYEDCFLPFNVTVLPSTSVHSLGAPLSLRCISSTIYLPHKIYWWRVRQGEPAKSLCGNHIYCNISSLSYEDNAVYQCYIKSLTASGRRFAVSGRLEIQLSDVFTGELRLRLKDKRFERDYKMKTSVLYKKMEKVIQNELMKILHDGNTRNYSDVHFHIKQFSNCSGWLCMAGVLSIHNNTLRLKNQSVLNWMNDFVAGFKTEFNAFKLDYVFLYVRDGCLPKRSKMKVINNKYSWPATYSGNTAKLPCVGYCLQTAYKTCRRKKGNNYAYWQRTNAANCFKGCDLNRELKEIYNINFTAENIDPVSSRLVAISSRANLTHENIWYIVKAFEHFAAVFQLIAESSSEVSRTDVALHNIMISIDNLISLDKNILKESEMLHNTSTRILKMIGQLAESISTKVPYSINRINFALGGVAIIIDDFNGMTVVMKVTEKKRKTMEIQTEINNFFNPGNLVRIIIPASIKKYFKQSNSTTKIVASTFNDANLFTELLNLNEILYEINSYVISVQVRGCSIHNLNDPVLITFSAVNRSIFSHKKECVYWNIESKKWSKDGCILQSTNEINSTVTCACNHLTNFAVMFATVPPEGIHGIILSYITYAGIAISFAGELLTLVTYIIFPMLRKKTPPKILMNLCVALIMTDILFIVGNKTKVSVDGCKTISFFLQYFFLTVFSWGALEGFYTFRSIVFPMRVEINNFMQKAALFGWGIPSILTGIGAVISLEDYVGDHWCVVKDMPFLTTVLAPICGVLFFNIICLIGIMCTITKSAKTYKSNTMKMKNRFRITFGFMVIFGITWIFGFFVITNGVIVLQYIFCGFCSLKGLYIFLLYCIRSPKHRWVWCAFFRGISLKEIERSGTRSSQMNRLNTYDTSNLSSIKGSSLPTFGISDKAGRFSGLLRLASLSSSNKSVDNDKIYSVSTSSSSKKLIDDGRSSSNA